VNGRDRTVDALRAVAILGVVLGHWLVSAVVADPYRISEVHGESPLSYAHWLVPLSWFLQTLGPFFFAGGYAAAKSLARRPPGTWLRTRIWRLVRPVLSFAVVWVPALLLLAFVGAPARTSHVIESLVTHPLWFLLAYLVLTVLSPCLIKVGPWLILPAIALVALSDALRGSGLPAWLALVTVPVGWAVPYLLGIALAENRLGRWAGPLLLGLGVAGGAILILALGYPASAVGVPGDNFSNLDPPSLFAMALAFTQIGVFLLVRRKLTSLLNHSIVWMPILMLNLAAMTIFVWHQTALLFVTFAGMLAGRPAGLLDTPDGAWPLDRLRWLPVFALVLVVLVAVFHRFEVGASKMSVGPGTMVGSDADHQRREEGRT
jgi:fucose 4-O-acetylase-like acetyltransferase